jgi:hypothetical protein
MSEDDDIVFPMWGTEMDDAGYTGLVVGATLRWEMALMSPAESMDYMAELAHMLPEMLDSANERAEARHRAECDSNEAAAERAWDEAAAEAMVEAAVAAAAAEAAEAEELTRPKPKPA